MTHRTRRLLAAVGVAVLTGAVYLPVLRAGFVDWDDPEYVVENFAIRVLNLTLLKWAFSTFYEGNWDPLTWISHAVDYAVWGLNPLGHHLTSVALHAVNTLLVALVSMRVAETHAARQGVAAPERQTGERRVLLTGVVVAALFGLHPLHVESVAWVAERKDVLCALFFLLSVLAYSAHAGRPPRWSAVVTSRPLTLALGCFVLALLSKPMAVSLPGVLLILDWYPFARIGSRRTALAAVAEKLPFVLLSVGSGIATVFAQRAAGAMGLTDVVPLPQRLLVAARAVTAYLGKMVWPVDLLPLYAYPTDIAATRGEFLLPTIAVIGGTVGAVVAARRAPQWAALWGYYVMTLVPVLGLVPVGSHAMADRFTYLPSLAPFLLVGVVAAASWARVARTFGPRVATLGGSFIALVVFGALSRVTIAQIGLWHDSVTLWNAVIAKEPMRSAIPYNNRGFAYVEQERYEEAIADYDTAIAVAPLYWRAWFNRGVAWLEKGEADGAIADFDRALQIWPMFRTYHMRGMAFEKKGMTAAARRDYERAIALEPSYVEPYLSLGVLHGRMGQLDRAVALFDEAIAIDPNHPRAYGNRGFAYALRGEPDKALRDFDRANQLDPSNADGFINRGNLHRQLGDYARAAADFRTACTLGRREACRMVE